MRLAVPKFLALSLLSIAALSLPPLELPQRLDRALYDLWSRLAPLPAPSDLVVVAIDGLADLEALALLAQKPRADLLVTTLEHAPTSRPSKPTLLGPIAIASPQMPILRSTGWLEGGYLWPSLDLGAVIRFERPLLGDTAGTASLAYAAAQRLDFEAVAAGKRRDAGALTGTAGSDRYGRRWLRFFEPQSFLRASLDDIRGDASVLSQKTVLAGTSHGGSYRSPVGLITELDLVAHALAGYRTGAFVTTNNWLALLAWSLTGLWIFGSNTLTPAGPARIAVLGAGTIGLLGAAAVAFAAVGLWVPVGGPGILLLTSFGRLSGYAPSDRPPDAGRPPRNLLDARQLNASGQLAEAWSIYRRLPMSTERLPEAYELAASLAARGERQLAAEAFHRIAQADASFKDVAQQLLAVCADRLIELPDQPQLDMLGRYDILGPIGRGTTGVVYLGRDPSINRIVAVKAIHFDIEFEAGYVDEARDRFNREAYTAGSLAHPSILTIYDIGEEEGVAYIAMEYVRGARLDAYASPESLLPTVVALELVARAADALEYAHRHNVVHRDIKPANIMYDSSTDLLKITDFGIARLMDVSRTRTGVILGTPAYMSPEQLQGENVNGHTDLFALGVTLYQLLTGYLPFRGTSMTDLMFVIANEPHIPVTSIRADLPPGLDKLFECALAKDPAARFQDGTTMADAIRSMCHRLHS